MVLFYLLSSCLSDISVFIFSLLVLFEGGLACDVCSSLLFSSLGVVVVLLEFWLLLVLSLELPLLLGLFEVSLESTLLLELPSLLEFSLLLGLFVLLLELELPLLLGLFGLLVVPLLLLELLFELLLLELELLLFEVVLKVFSLFELVFKVLFLLAMLANFVINYI